jgi:hypothetical protein
MGSPLEYLFRDLLFIAVALACLVFLVRTWQARRRRTRSTRGFDVVVERSDSDRSPHP